MARAKLGRLRGLLLLTTAAPATVAAAATLLPAGPAVWAAGAAATAAAAAGVWAATRPLARLGADCERLAEEDEAIDLPVGRTDEVGVFARALAAQDRRRADVLAAGKADLTSAAEFLQRLSDTGKAVAEPAFGGPWVVEAANLASATREHARTVFQTRHKLNTAIRILHAMPEAVVATDEIGAVRYLNPAAEKLFGKPAATMGRKPVSALFDAPPAAADPHGRPVHDPAAITAWVIRGSGEAVAAVARPGGAALVELAVARGGGGESEAARVLVARDLTSDAARLAADRYRVREEAARTAWATAARIGDAATETILNQTRLLSSDAKQSGHRDVLLPRVTAVRQQAHGLELYFRTARWLGDLLWSQPPAQRRTEFMAGEAAKAAADQLAPRFAARGNTLTITDRGGWVFCDEEWLRTALLGVLTHACDAGTDVAVGLHLKTLPPTPAAPEGRVAFDVIDAGPPLSAADRAALDRPFGGLDSAGVLKDEAGYLPGLLLAHRLSTGLGGELTFDATPSGRLIVRLEVPSRLPAGPADRPQDLGDGAGAPEELCLGWRLGMPA